MTYEELAAFVHRANRAIKNQRYRPAFVVRPPRNLEARRARVVDRYPPGRRLTVDAALGRHLFIEDQDGRRYVDLHPASAFPVAVVLPVGPRLYVRVAGEQRQYVLPAAAARLSSLRPTRVTAARRGAEHVAFHRLYQLPFSAASTLEYRSAAAVLTYARVERRPGWPRPVLGATAVAFAAGGAVLTALAASERADAEGAPQDAQVRAADPIRTYKQVAVGLYSTAGAAAVGLLVYWLWPEGSDVEKIIERPSSPEPAGAGLRF